MAANQVLEPGAEYGRLAFDVFVMEKWDHAADAANDHQQWDSLARQYLSLTPLQRFPYHREAQRRTTSAGYVMTSQDVRRVFTPHQTAQERNLLASRASRTAHDPIFLRTCYDPALASAYDTLAQHFVGEPAEVIEPDGVFDDAALYLVDSEDGDDGDEEGGDGGLARFLLRVPELVDVTRCRSEKEYARRTQGPPAPAGGGKPETVGFVYLVDRQALEEGVLKVCWLDGNGGCIWWNRIDPELVLDLTGKWEATASMEEVLSCADSDEKGAMLEP